MVSKTTKPLAEQTALIEQSQLPDGVVIPSTVSNDGTWHTAVLVGEGMFGNMAALESIGVSDGLAVAVILVLPVSKNTDERWLRDRVTEFNWISRELVIGKAQHNSAEIDADEVVALRERTPANLKE